MPTDTPKGKTKGKGTKTEQFDAAYFDRFYESPKTRVYGAGQVANLAMGVTGMISWFGAEIESVLDVGAGTGLWRDWFRKTLPAVKYRSTDVSEFACAKYGHEQRDITKWRGREKYDLIVCQGVAPYFNDEEYDQAIENIAAMSRGFLYFEAITDVDLREVCDDQRTDLGVHPRTAKRYRKTLSKYFHTLGLGLYYSKQGGLGFYELERGLD